MRKVIALVLGKSDFKPELADRHDLPIQARLTDEAFDASLDCMVIIANDRLIKNRYGDIPKADGK
ncbi:hypothetical protein [Pandoraea apista]|uniref:hypothetical protein n=1 Tax=Pandoraea apista TaxID=93218 RepID=UPI00065A15CD|nr:hypothetical protein [Pandoraea apista]ALS63640.1 hypothetical protein AT395_00270 [Pandoraea apista]CFB63168.1 hypothetical protein LMG16407_03243 [Pandoraea apista]